MSRADIEWGDSDLEIAMSHEAISSALLVSFVVRALLLTLPHPALWNPPAIATRAPDISTRSLSVQLSASHHRTRPYRTEQIFPRHQPVDRPTPGGSALLETSSPRRIAPPPDYQLARALDRQVEVIDGIVHAVTEPSAADATGELLLRLIVDKKVRSNTCKGSFDAIAPTRK